MTGRPLDTPTWAAAQVLDKRRWETRRVGDKALLDHWVNMDLVPDLLGINIKMLGLKTRQEGINTGDAEASNEFFGGDARFGTDHLIRGFTKHGRGSSVMETVFGRH